MKAYYFTMICVIGSFMVFHGCNSKGYEIEEENIQVDSDTARVSNSEVKQELVEPKVEIKQETIQTSKISLISYTVQIGAFTTESNASKFLESAEKVLRGDIYFKLINGLYKVRIGKFFSNDEALSNLKLIQDSGFTDAFIIELK